MGSSNPYDETQEWLPEQSQVAGVPYADPTYYAAWQQQTQVNYPYNTGNVPGVQIVAQGNQEPGTQQDRQAADRMPKAQAISMARALKRSIVVASVAVFGVLSGLVATHLQTTTTSQSTSTPASQNTSSSSNSNSPSTSSSTSSSNADANSGSNQNPSDTTNSGGFFNQQGGGGYGFGNGDSAQPPVSNSRVS